MVVMNNFGTHNRSLSSGTAHLRSTLHSQGCVTSRVMGRYVPRQLCSRGHRLASSSTAQEALNADSSIVDGQFATTIPSYHQQRGSFVTNSLCVHNSLSSSSTGSQVSARDRSTSSTTSTTSSVTVYNNILQHARQRNCDGSISISGEPSNSSLSNSAVIRSRSSSLLTAKTGLLVYGAGVTGLGRRHSNEDRHALALLNIDTGIAAHPWIYGGVFDGHGGDATAANLADLFHHGLQQQLQRAQRQQTDYSAALIRAFTDFDSYWAARCPDKSGSTAVMALLDGDQLLVANAGDSAAILARGGISGGFTAHRLSTLHKPDDPDEAARIRASNGIVERHPRVSNAWRALIDPSMLPKEELASRVALTVTRGFGDYSFKRAFAPLVSAEPAVQQLQLCPRDKLLLLVSDGATDALHDKSMMQVALAAAEQAKQHATDRQQMAHAAATAVRDTALRMGAVDNVTVVALWLDWEN